MSSVLPTSFRIGPEKNHFEYKKVAYQQLWKCSRASEEKDKKRTLFLYQKEDKSWIAADAAKDCAQKQRVIDNGTPVFVSTDSDAIQQGRHAWKHCKYPDMKAMVFDTIVHGNAGQTSSEWLRPPTERSRSRDSD